jgi:hypothetical protein
MTQFDLDVISRASRGCCGGLFEDKLIQSVCHDGKNYYVGFSWMNNQRMSSIAVMKDLNFRTASVIRGADLMLNHCNDMEFNPDDGKIYVATGTNVIAEVTRETLQVHSVRLLDTDAWAIARYPDGSWFVFDGDVTWKYSRDFAKKQVTSTGNTEKIRQICGDGYWQGAFMADGEPFLIWSVKDSRQDHYKGTALVSGKEILYSPGDMEVEGGMMIGGALEFVYGQLRFGGAYWDMNSQMKTVYKAFRDVKAAAGNITLDMADAVPDGYELTAAEVNVKKGSSWRTLPYLSGTSITMQVLKVAGKRVVLKAKDDFGTVQLQVTGFCRKT